MKITEQEVRDVADLAHLKLSDAEVAGFRADLDGILEQVDKLNEVDVSGVEPMAQVLFEQSAGLRADIPERPLSNEAALANAPVRGAGCYKTPPIIERS